MATKDDTQARAPRGTKNVAQAFFTALDGLSEGQQPAVAKAALSAIRDALKARRLKAREAAARARMKAKTKAPARRKVKAVAAAKPVAAKRAAASKPAKRKASRKLVSAAAPNAGKA